MIVSRIIKFEYVGACRYTGYINKSIKFTLGCGHKLYRKASAGVPKKMKARCPECEKDAR